MTPAADHAQHIFDLMEKAGAPYYSPELVEAEEQPTFILVWDDSVQMTRMIVFCEDEPGAGAALDFGRSQIALQENPEWYIAEAWWPPNGKLVDGDKE